MPVRSIHVRKAQKLGIPREIADRVSRLKDRPSRYLPGYAHWGFNHGVGTNVKYFRIGELPGLFASFHHNLLDRVHFARKVGRKALALLTTFAPARILTWYPGKMLSNVLIPDLLPPFSLRRRMKIVNAIYTLIYNKYYKYHLSLSCGISILGVMVLHSILTKRLDSD